MRTAWQPTPEFLPGEFHGQRSLMGFSPWGGRETRLKQLSVQDLEDTFTSQGTPKITSTPSEIRKGPGIEAAIGPWKEQPSHHLDVSPSCPQDVRQ